MRIRLTAAVLLACAAPAAAQNAVLRPGSGQVTGSSLRERVDPFDLYEAGDEQPVGTMTLRTRFATVGGVEAVTRKETTLVDGELVQSDSFALDRRTLAPLHARMENEVQTELLDFRPDEVRRVVDADWGADTSHIAVYAPVFYAGAMDLLLGALPLAEGFAAELAVFDAEAGSAIVRVAVEAAEELRVPGDRPARTWRVAVHPGTSAGTYWMDRESHALVQFESADGGVRIVRSRGVRSRARPTR
jgi:hypothetical protein